MFSHAPNEYQCPFCLLLQGISNQHVISVQDDIIYQDDLVTAFLCCGQVSGNHGNVLVIPNEHYENVYELPIRFALPLHRVVKLLAITMKEVYQCDGISTRQHNEPGGHQDVWHYHIHVSPRYDNDRLYPRLSEATLMPLEERVKHVSQLKTVLADVIEDVETIGNF